MKNRIIITIAALLGVGYWVLGDGGWCHAQTANSKNIREKLSAFVESKEYGVHTMVDMNCIMIDGSGMCGGCRLTVDGQRKFTCVDGPEFDGHLVDFDEAIARSKIYEKQEARVFQRRHHCTLQELADREEAARKAAKEGK